MHRSVLVVEDDLDIQQAIRDALLVIGCRVNVASNGEEAFEVLKKIERPCLILLDLMMPVMNGQEFYLRQRQQKELADIPVVVVTADGSAKDKAQKMGAQDGIRKPLQFNTLFEVARKYCGVG